MGLYAVADIILLGDLISFFNVLTCPLTTYLWCSFCISRWIVRQQISHPVSSNGEDIPDQHPSYQDHLKLTFGCKHYKRNCKLLVACCNQLYTCRHCHDEVADHSLDRYDIMVTFLLSSCQFSCFLFSPSGLPLLLIYIQEICYKDDVHEMLENSADWALVFHCFLQ